jgi:hypothetical protein
MVKMVMVSGDSPDGVVVTMMLAMLLIWTLMVSNGD